ncbi:MAG: hypothetical protein IJJ35_08370 [Exiguobacterium sp.]|uniref:hypothetical protein n=1 Tax=Exiguobacterium TaxID=33986 RepID=UPI001BE80CCF|nr:MULTISPECIES: hypothetical protein [unclassified Exiguobacterium]MBQ6459597.1 hypothetical protein [Exiguobacterium sp.]MBR3216492.1 hypothetical protein [Exiguobacterium sp.]
MVELSFGLLVLLGCVIALKPIVLKTDRPNFRYIPVATLLFGAMIFLVLAIGVGGKMGIAYGVVSIAYFIACFGAYMYVHTRTS